MSPEERTERIVLSGCLHDCGGRCVLRVHVKDRVITRIETDDGDEPQLRACLRGRAYRQRVYAPDRLRYPLKRRGARGEGKFERVSWDDALDLVAKELKRVKEVYGPASILLIGGGGTQGMLHGPSRVARLLSMFGGYTRTWGAASFEGALYASMATYGTMRTGNTRDDLLNSRLIVMWGWNPTETIQDTNTSYYLAQAREAGARIICVDPRFTNSAVALAHQWIPIRPGTDIAMLLAMAYIIIQDNLQDQKFLDTYTTGFERYKDYVMGREDGIVKTPVWAEAITGVPATTIEKLAQEYATTKPAALIAGWGPGRSVLGEQYHRAANILTAMTGNIGTHGGYAAGFMRAYIGRERAHPREGHNPVEEGAPPRPYSLTALRGGTNPSSARIHSAMIWDAILKGKAGGYPCQPKLLYLVGSNLLNSAPNINKGIEALRKLEFVVVHEQFLTPTAKFADVVLPVNTFLERSDIASAWLGEPNYIYYNKAIDSLPESKSDLEISIELAPRLGVLNYGVWDEETRLKEIAHDRPDTADFNQFKEKGNVKLKFQEPIVSFKKQIQDPQHNPFLTLSGKIEIYSQLLADMASPLVPPVPKFIETWEGYKDQLAQKYPLQLITTHFKRRSHSTLDNILWLRELEPQEVWINSADAQAREISQGDRVMIFNDRGKVTLPAKVTERIMPGVVNISEGAWYDPDEHGIDRGGCPNVLTKDDHSPGGAHPCNTALVQVTKVQRGD